MSDDSFFIVPCPRCGRPCKVAKPRNPDARILRLATKETAAAGACLCVNCAATEFYKTVLEADELFKMSPYGRENGAKCLLLPHMQKQFAEVLRAGNADASPDELDWLAIVEHWDLPFPKIERPRKKRTP